MGAVGDRRVGVLPVQNDFLWQSKWNIIFLMNLDKVNLSGAARAPTRHQVTRFSSRCSWPFFSASSIFFSFNRHLRSFRKKKQTNKSINRLHPSIRELLFWNELNCSLFWLNIDLKQRTMLENISSDIGLNQKTKLSKRKTWLENSSYNLSLPPSIVPCLVVRICSLWVSVSPPNRSSSFLSKTKPCPLQRDR